MHSAHDRNQRKTRALALIAEALDLLLENDAPTTTSARVEVSTVRLPADAKNGAAFNRACRSGRVEGARKVGRVWICSLDAWNRRAPATTPKGIVYRDLKPSKRQRRHPTNANELRDDVLAELGLTPAKRAS